MDGTCFPDRLIECGGMFIYQGKADLVRELAKSLNLR
jgi:hypothetical protein